MKQNIKISKAQPRDSEGITEVYYKTWLATYPNKKYNITVEDIKYKYKNRKKKEEILRRREKIAHLKKECKMFVAKHNNKVVGVCNIIIDKDQNELKAIYLLPKYHGKGIGYMLWQNVQKYFNEKNKTIVKVAEYNTKAILFYKKLGFVKTGKHFFDEKFKMRNGALIPEIKMIIKSKK